MEGQLHLPQLKDLVAATGKLATLPGTVIELLGILNDPTASAAQVQKILERDPAMTANVLKICNSAFYGVRREISSVRDALVMLGNRRTATLAFASSMAPVMRRDLLGYGLSREQFWRHALVSAAAAAEVAVRLDRSDLQCEAFTAGLIHDLGMIVLDPVLVASELELAVEGPLFGVCRQETKLLGYNHCQAGAMLADSWGFPEILIQPIADHHLPVNGGPHQHLVRAVAAGNIIAQALDPDLNQECQDQVPQCLIELDLDPDLLEQLRLDLTDNLGEICDAATALVPVRS
jgi:HD-like signal output (HDOD) protein